MTKYIGSQVSPSIRTSICPYEVFLDFDLIWCVGRPRPDIQTSVTSTRSNVKVMDLLKFQKLHFSSSISFIIFA